MNCRDFLAEFEERSNVLSQTAELHLNDCPECKKTSRDQMRVWQMIDELRRVDAPDDFDFRVKARIAKSKPADFQPQFFPALRYVLPVGLIVLVLGLVVYNASYFSGSTPEVSEIIAPQMQKEREISPINSFSANQTAGTNTNDEILVSQAANVNVELADENQKKDLVTVKSPVKTRGNNPKKNYEDDAVMSRDLLLRPPPPPSLPLGIDPNRKIETSPNTINQNPITDVQILSFMGIETVSENGNKKVKAVKSQSLAERSGIKTGDVIEAIDGKRVGGEPVRMETFESKKLTVVRDAKRIEITLQNKLN
jgi:membrane-associated protease RseP (regulator of RpoE activity)